MFFDDPYLIYLASGLLILPCLLLASWASARVHKVFARYSGMPTSTDWTGSDVARMLLEHNGIFDVAVAAGKGKLTDNFNPRTMTVTLSQSTYASNSVAAVAVSAHEVGHVVQRQRGYAFYRLRTLLVPLTNIGSVLAFPLVIIGVILEWTLATPFAGNVIVFVGVCLYALSTVFTLVTLPVELNASSRAKRMLAETGVLVTEEEQAAAAKVLSAAAMTYVASLLTSLVFFLRFLFYVLMLTRRRNN